MALSILVSVAAVAALAVSVVAYNRAAMSYTQKNYYQDATLDSGVMNHAIQGNQPVTLSIPNDMSSLVGQTISIDCVSAGGHRVVITSGSLPTRWQLPSAQVAQCNGAGSGMTFRVTGPYTLRFVGPPTGMTFS